MQKSVSMQTSVRTGGRLLERNVGFLESEIQVPGAALTSRRIISDSRLTFLASVLSSLKLGVCPG